MFSQHHRSHQTTKEHDEIDLMMNEFSNEMERQTDFTSSISAATEELSSSSEEIQSSISKVSIQLKDRNCFDSRPKFNESFKHTVNN